MVDTEKICFVCKDAAVEADTEFEGKPTHWWHLSEVTRTAMSSRAIEREETEMGRQPRKDVDLAAYKADYEAGLPVKELERKYNIGRGTTSKWAHRAGCLMRGSGFRSHAHGNGSDPAHKAKRKTAIVKAAAQPAVILSEAKDLALPANGTHTRCRVAMFEVEGDQAAVLAAIEAVKTALSRAA